MFKKINTIKNLGIFRDWQWPSEGMDEFRKFNIIYGWNGCGKSTLTRLFQKVETKEFSGDFSDVEFSFEDYDGNKAESSDLESITTKVRVFNQRFLSRNISWDNCQTEVIAGIGKDAIELKKRIEKNENELGNCKDILGKKKTEQTKIESDLIKLLRKEAKSIKELIGYKNPDGYYNNFDTAKLQITCDEYNTSDSNELTEKDYIKHEQVIGSSLREKITEGLSFNQISIDADNSNENNIAGSLGNLKAFLKTTVQNKAIGRWKNANSWVREGRDIHNQHNEKETCIFCGKNFPDDFWETLGGHFSSEYEEFLQLCDRAISDCDNYIVNNVEGIQNRLYDDLQTKFAENVNEIESARVKINQVVNSVNDALLSKKSNPLGENQLVINGATLEVDYKHIVEKHAEINGIISEHNNRCDTFNDEVKISKAIIVKHHIASFYDSYKQSKDTLNKLRQEVSDNGDLAKKISELAEFVSKDREDISNYGIKLDVFNGLLSRFLGRDDITLDLYDTGDGTYYRIIRDGCNAKNLSEGEKTAIAFIYFITKLQEEGFELNDGVVVIDDPVSSLDSTFMFNAFSFLRDQVKLAKQLFVFTHNFTFLRLVTRWFEGANQGIIRKNVELRSKSLPEKPLRASFYMIRNDWADNKRLALLQKLDPFLHGYQTEYEYIYKELRNYSSLVNVPLERYYNVPNLARKLLEIFLGFKHPGKINLKDRLEKETEFDQIAKDKIFNFVNFHSHGGADRAQGVDMSFLSETPVVVKNIFELLKHIDVKHVERMDELIEKKLKTTDLIRIGERKWTQERDQLK